MSNLPVLLAILPMTGAVVSVLVGLWRPAAAQAAAAIGVGGALLVAVAAVAAVHDGTVLVHEIGGWAPAIGIEYRLDRLSAYLAVVIAGIGFLAVTYPVREGFLREHRRGLPLYGLIGLLMAGLLGVVVSGDLFHLFVFLEVFAIATYALVATGGDRAVFAAFRYLLIGTAGSGFYLLGVGFIYFSAGSLNMGELAQLLPVLGASPTITAAAVLITVGLGIKMAVFPLHVWLPDAHTNAPPAVAALLAAVQVKVGAYALLRILFGVFEPAYVIETLPLTTALTWFSAAGILVGSALAIAQRDLKRMLAYSTVAQLGYIGLGIGLATPLALVGALLHVLNHAVMKSSMFFVAGGLLAQGGLRDVTRFAGLGRKMPITMAAFTVAAVSMVGIPPTGGFFSKFYLVSGAIEAGRTTGVIVAVVVVVSSLMTATYFLRVLEQVWVRDPIDDAVRGAFEPGARVVAPVALLAVVLLVVGVTNVQLVEVLLRPIADGMLTAR